MLLSIVIIVAQTVVLHKLFWAIAGRMPPRVRADVSHLSPEQRRRYAVWTNVLGTILYMSLWPVIAVAWFIAFQLLAEFAGSDLDGVVYLHPSMFATRILTATAVGFVLCAPAALVLLRLIFWRTYHERMACGDAHYAVDVRKLMYVYFVWVVPMCFEWDVHWALACTAFTEDEIVERRWWSFAEDRHPYTAVKRIEGVKPYERRPTQLPQEPEFLIEFDDGSHWTSVDNMHPSRESDLEAVELASRKSSVPIRWVAAID
jgi:hypothetical protein